MARFDREFFETLTERYLSMNADFKRMSGQPIFSGGNPAVEVTLTDGTTYRLTFANSAWLHEDVMSAVAYRSAEERAPRLVTIPYSTIARVEVFEPERKEQTGFRIERQEQAKPATVTSSGTSARE